MRNRIRKRVVRKKCNYVRGAGGLVQTAAGLVLVGAAIKSLK